jgi:hypothetical protein
MYVYWIAMFAVWCFVLWLAGKFAEFNERED